jgi:hypothetical protein
MHGFSELKASFVDGIRRLVGYYKICIEKRGDYGEK